MSRFDDSNYIGLLLSQTNFLDGIPGEIDSFSVLTHNIEEATGEKADICIASGRAVVLVHLKESLLVERKWGKGLQAFTDVPKSHACETYEVHYDIFQVRDERYVADVISIVDAPGSLE